MANSTSTELANLLPEIVAEAIFQANERSLMRALVRNFNIPAGSGKTIIGEYTYQLSPYETFENTGVYQWPPGYNPKPLIARSIRNLALEYTEQKFTLRRT